MSLEFPRLSEGAWEKLSQVAVKGAEYDSRERQPHPKCLDGTRVDLLNYIYRLLDYREKNRLLWLHGTAGVGKSAVAFNVAERMRGLKVTAHTNVEKRLGGTFFFSRKHTERCMTGYFFATLVYQLASNFPSIREEVNRAIRENPALLDPNKSLRDQMEALFLQPLRMLRFRLLGSPPLTFVIDALDECTSEPELIDLIHFLAQALREPDLPLTHILLTSRPESHICRIMQKEGVRSLVCEIPVMISGEGVTTIISLDGADVDNDIYTYLQHSFRELQSHHPHFPQPSTDQLERLASRAGRRFIVASTMMKFIDDGDNDPHDRLQLMLKLTSELLPGTEVYKLYDRILSTCTDPKRAYMHLSVVAALADPLPMSQISKLLGIALGRDVETTLTQLRSIVNIPSDSTLPVTIYHSSVRDYVSYTSNCSLPQVHDIPSPHSLLAHSSLRLMINEIPETTAILDALSELTRQSQAMQPQDPQRLRDSLGFLVRPPEPLSAVIVMLWLRGDRSSDLLSWLETPDGCAWLQTQGGEDWLRTQGGETWLGTPGGEDWLQAQGGEDWLQTQGGEEWLQTEGGVEWLQTKKGKNWLHSPGGKGWLQIQGGRDWLQSQDGRDWLQTQSGEDWLETPAGRDWLHTEGGDDWLQTSVGQNWLQTTGVRDWLQTPRGRAWLQTQGGQVWLQTLGMRPWLQTPGGRDWLETQGGGDWLETQGGGDWLRTQGGEDWIQTQGGRDWLQTQGGKVWLRTKGGRVWLKAQGGKDWLQTKGGKEWLQTQRKRDWLQTSGGRAWVQTPVQALVRVRPQCVQALVQTLDREPWVQTQGGRNWLKTQQGHEWLQTRGGQDWLQTQGGRDWLQTPGGRDWLQMSCGRDWLQTPHGQAWQCTPAASVWVTMKEFSSMLEAISEYIIVPEMPLPPAFQVIQQFKALPDFLMFPIFLALRHQDCPNSALPKGLCPPDREIIHAMHAFTAFANEAQNQSRSASDALKYACQNWALHLSHTPNPYDETLNNLFQAFWSRHLLSWLEWQWCMKGLRSCLIVLSDGQKFAKSGSVYVQYSDTTQINSCTLLQHAELTAHKQARSMTALFLNTLSPVAHSILHILCLCTDQ